MARFIRVIEFTNQEYVINIDVIQAITSVGKDGVEMTKIWLTNRDITVREPFGNVIEKIERALRTEQIL
ncbi:hypothetical protein [Larkinella arboricola]|uniref:hypothetical protein n=1 Tax=Larkinella arboricola TaxID=643671 RepID=UPI000DB9CF42|nr:hypothetical protein [Larkinella arboricola]